MSWAENNGARLYYEVHGRGPAVLFVHGSGGHHAAWWQQVTALRDDYTVITMDLRGFGCSRWDGDHDCAAFPGDIIAVLDAVAMKRDGEVGGGWPGRAVLVGQSIGAAAALRAALDRPDRASGVVLAHSLGGLKHPELATLVKADRAAAEKLPVLDRLLTPEFRAQRPDLAFLFRQMGTFNTAKMADLRNLGSDGPTLGELACSTRRSAGSWPRSPRVRSRAPDAPARRPPTGAGRTPTRICGSCSSSRSSTRENPGVSQTASSLVATYSPSESFGEVLGERSAPGRRRTNLHRQS